MLQHTYVAKIDVDMKLEMNLKITRKKGEKENGTE